MLPEEFRRFAHEAVDWAAEYLSHPECYPVLPRVKPGQVAHALPPSGPEQGEPMERILEDFRSLIVPAVTHWNHPGFMAYFANSAPGPGIIAEVLATALNSNAMIWKTSPAATELEQVVLDWLREWMGLPAGLFGITYDTASTSSMHAIAAAREMADPEARTLGASRGLTLYTSEQSHSSIEKGAIAIGIGQKNVRKIAADAEFRMRPEALAAAVEADVAAGLRPFCVVATVGTTSTTSIDAIPPIADIAGRHRMWLHVDAAYAGSAAILPELRHILDGAERADSLVVNPHKWFLTPVELSILYTRRPEILRRAFSLVPEYLRTAEDSYAINYMDYGVPLGHRFRALKLWFIMRYYGRERMAQMIRDQIAWAAELADAVDADPRFERAAPAPFSAVCFRAKAGDDRSRSILETVNASGEFFLSHTVLHGKYTLRVAIGNMGTTRDHVMRAWQMIQRSAAD
jgi:aromatic-L-amino-acid/L-tryptophan decarboxylase